MSQKRFQSPNFKFSFVIDYYLEHYQHLGEDASRLFAKTISPDLSAPPEVQERLGALFAEWFIFDYQLPNGRTPLQDYVLENPEQQSNSVIRRFKESVETQVAADFWISKVNAAAGLLELEAVEGGKTYFVYDWTLSKELDGTEGMLGMRIIQVEGRWVTAGNPIYYLPAKPTDRAKDMMRDSERSTFLDMVKLHFGKTEKQGLEQNAVPLSLDDVAPGDLAKTIDSLKNRYIILLKKLPGAPDWDALRRGIFDEEEAEFPMDTFQRLFPFEFPDEETVKEMVNIYFSAWNVLPHKAQKNS